MIPTNKTLEHGSEGRTSGDSVTNLDPQLSSRTRPDNSDSSKRQSTQDRLRDRQHRRLIVSVPVRSVLIAIASLIVALPAYAQIQTSIPPSSSTVDARGVDIVSGDYTFETTEVVVGPTGAGGLVHGRRYAGDKSTYGWRDTLAGTVEIQRDSSSNETGAIVSVGGSSVVFDFAGGVYTPKVDNGASLTLSANETEYTYTSRFGSKFRFDKSYSDNHFWRVDGAVIVEVIHPNDAKTTYHHTSATVNTETRYRIQSVSNSYGYQIHFEYANDNPATVAELDGDWMRRTKAIGINRAYTFCATDATSCSDSSYEWPYVTYSQPQSDTERVTNALNQNIDYVFDGGLRQIKRDSGSVAVEIQYSTSYGHVDSVSAGGLTHSYSDPIPLIIAEQEYAREIRVLTANGSALAGAGLTRVDYTLEPRGIDKIIRFDTPGDATGMYRSVTYERDQQGKVKVVRDHTGRATHYEYDSRGNITETRQKATGMSDIVTSAHYPGSCTPGTINTCNRPDWTEDARGYRTQYDYEPHGGLKSVTYPGESGGAPFGSGNTPQVRYAYGTRTARFRNSSDPSSLIDGPPTVVRTSVSLCNTGNSPCLGQARETVTTFEFEPTSLRNNILATSVTMASGDGLKSSTTTLGWDEYARQSWIDGPDTGAADRAHFAYDALGRRIFSSGPDPDGTGAGQPLKPRAVRTEYDADGFVTAVEQGTTASAANWGSFHVLGRVEQGYDTYRRPVKRRYIAGGVTHALIHTGFDAASRLECIAYRMDPSTFYTSNETACEQSAVGSPGDRISKRHYNNFGDLIRVESGYTSALSQDTQTFTHTSTGAIATVTDANGNLTQYVYDAFGRPWITRYPTDTGATQFSSSEEIVYDAYGRIASFEQRDEHVFEFSYDNLGRRLTVDALGTDPVLTFTYDNVGRVRSAERGGQTLTYDYDALGRLMSETGSHGSVVYHYDAAGRRSQIDYPGAGNFFVTYKYNAAGDLEFIREMGATSGVGVLAEFEYDDWGRRTKLTRGNGVVTTYDFDAAGQLETLVNDLSGIEDDQTLTFDYNTANQIIGRTNSNPTYEYAAPAAVFVDYDVNGLNQYASIDAVNRFFDDRGNLTDDGVSEYTYDQFNQLRSVVGVASFSYDPLGRLSEQTVGGSTTDYLYDGVDLIAEYDGGTVLKRYVHGPGIDEPLVEYEGSGTNDRTFLIADERGSIVAGTNSSGNRTYINRYDEYGKPQATNQGLFQYTGQVYLAAAEIYHYKARAYDPEHGQFLQADPIGYAAGMNLYAYVGGDPVNFRDPMGLDLNDNHSGPLNHLRQINRFGGQFVFDVFGPDVDAYQLHLDHVAANTAPDAGGYNSQMVQPTNPELSRQIEDRFAKGRNLEISLPEFIDGEYEYTILRITSDPSWVDTGEPYTLADVSKVAVIPFPPIAFFENWQPGVAIESVTLVTYQGQELYGNVSRIRRRGHPASGEILYSDNLGRLGFGKYGALRSIITGTQYSGLLFRLVDMQRPDGVILSD